MYIRFQVQKSPTRWLVARSRGVGMSKCIIAGAARTCTLCELIRKGGTVEEFKDQLFASSTTSSDVLRSRLPQLERLASTSATVGPTSSPLSPSHSNSTLPYGSPCHLLSENRPQRFGCFCELEPLRFLRLDHHRRQNAFRSLRHQAVHRDLPPQGRPVYVLISAHAQCQKRRNILSPRNLCKWHNEA